MNTPFFLKPVPFAFVILLASSTIAFSNISSALAYDPGPLPVAAQPKATQKSSKPSQASAFIIEALRKYKLTLISGGSVGWLTKTFPNEPAHIAIVPLNNDMKQFLSHFSYRTIEANDENRSKILQAINGARDDYSRGLAVAPFLVDVLSQSFWDTTTDISSPNAYEAQTQILLNADTRVLTTDTDALADFLKLSYDGK